LIPGNLFLACHILYCQSSFCSIFRYDDFRPR
jgi:hypothetical protein